MIYPLVIKHGMLENPLFMVDFPSFPSWKPPWLVRVFPSQPRLMTPEGIFHNHPTIIPLLSRYYPCVGTLWAYSRTLQTWKMHHVLQKKANQKCQKKCTCKTQCKKNMHITNARKMQVQKRNSQIFAFFMHFPGFCNFFSKIMFV